MKDFVRMFLMIAIVMGTMALFVYLGLILNYWVMAIIQLFLSVGIILLFIFKFYKWFGR